MPKKIVYISPVPLTDRLSRDWCLSYLRGKGVDWEFWDVPEIWPAGQGASRPGQPGLTLIRDFEELETRTARPEYDGALFILLMPHDSRHHRLYRMLTRRRRRTAQFEWGHLPVRALGRRVTIARLLRRPDKAPAAVWNKLVILLSRRLGFVKPHALVFTAGRSAAAVHPNALKTVPINLCDYDLFQEVSREPGRLVPEKYCVFLDNAQAHNPDLAVEGIPFLDKDRYFASLNRFFGLLEARFGIPVVIAAHPKSDYPPKLFEGRRVIKSATPALVKDSEFVLCHHSTAIGYAVLAKKPILFFYTGEMGTLYRESRIRPMKGFAECLGAAMLGADDVKSPGEIALAPVDERLYENYKYDYLTSPETERAFTRDIVLGEFKAAD